MNDRGRVHVTDVINGGAVLIGLLAVAPSYYNMIDKITVSSGPLADLLLELIVPMLLIGVVISVGVSARRRA